MPVGGGSFPNVGVRAVILGMAAFNANARAVNTQLAYMGRSADLLSRTSTQAFGGVGGAASNMAFAVQRANAALARTQAVAAAANQRAAQVMQNAQAASAAAAQRAAVVQQQAALSVQRVTAQAAAAQQRAVIASNLAQQAATAARVAAEQRAALAAQVAQQRVGLVTQQTSINVQRAHAAAAAAAQRAAAAQANASFVAAQGAARVAAAQQRAQFASTTSMRGISASGVAMAASLVASIGIIIAAFAGMGIAVAKVGAQYEQHLNAVGAIGEATSTEILTLSNAQLELSRQTTTTAQQLTTMSGELIKAGVSIEDVTEGTLRAVNNLVVASNGELEAARAATLVQVATKGFGASVEEAANAATAAVQRSTLTFTGYADAIRQGGGVAANFGLSIQEFSAAVGIMGKTLTSGTEIGTGFRMMLQRLQAPSAKALELMKQYGVSLYDSNGNARDFIEVLGILEQQFSDTAVTTGKLSQMERDHALATMFGGRAVKTVTALLNQGTDAYLEMLEATQRLSAEDLANRMLLPTAAKAQILNNNIQALGLAFYRGLDPYINVTISSLLDWMQAADLASSTNLGDAVGGFLFNAFKNFGELLDAWFIPLFRLAGEAIQFLIVNQIQLGQTVVNVASSIVTAVAAVIQGFINGYAGASQATGEFQNFLADSMAAIIEVWLAVGRAVMALAKIVVGAFLAQMAPGVTDGANVFNDAAGAILKAIGAVVEGARQMVASWAKSLGGLVSITGRVLGVVVSNFNIFLDQLSQLPLIGEMIGGVRASMGAFFTGVPTMSYEAGASIQGFIDDTLSGLKRIQSSFRMPVFRDFTVELREQLEAARKARDAEIERLRKPRDIGVPDVDTEPGFLPEDDDGGADKAAKKAAEDLANAIEKAHELVRDFNDDIAKETGKTAEAVAAAYGRAFESTQEALAKFDADVKQAFKDAEDAITELDTSRAIAADAEARRDALDQALEDQSEWNDQLREDQEVAYKRQQEDLEDANQRQRELREDHFDEILAQEARDRARLREDQDRDYDKGLRQLEDSLQNDQEAILESLDVRHEAEEAALKVSQETRERALEERLETEERALEAEQEQAERALEERLDLEKQAWEARRDLDEINREDARERAKAQQEFEKELATGVKRSIAEARLREKIQKIDEDTAQNRLELADQQAEDTAEREFDAQQDAQRTALEDQHEAARLAQQAAAEQATLDLRAKFQQEALSLRQAHEQELDRIHAEHEQARFELSERLERESLERSRTRAEEDRLFAEGQERAKQAFIEREDLKALLRRRANEDTERARQRELAVLDRLFREDQEAQVAQLQKTLDDEEYDRRIANINAERDKRLEVVQQTLDEEQKKIRDRLAQDIIDLKENLDERIETVRTQYIDRLEDLIRAGGEAINPLVDEITGNMVTGLEAIRTAAQEATRALAEAFGAAQALAEAEARRGNERAAANLLVNRQYGGTVPGPFGSKQLVMAHGGERFEGIGAHYSTLAAVRAAESMLNRGIGGASHVNNSYSYNVNANYGRVQPEGSVARDLSALVALTRR